jgi:hypothetical protein
MRSSAHPKRYSTFDGLSLRQKSILNFPIYAEIDGELVRVRIPDKN